MRIEINEINNNDFVKASLEIINKWYWKSEAGKKSSLEVFTDKVFNNIEEININEYVKFNVDFLVNRKLVRQENISILGQLYYDYKEAPYYYEQYNVNGNSSNFNGNNKKDIDKYLNLERIKRNFIPEPLAKAISNSKNPLDVSVVNAVYKKLIVPGVAEKSKIIS